MNKNIIAFRFTVPVRMKNILQGCGFQIHEVHEKLAESVESLRPELVLYGFCGCCADQMTDLNDMAKDNLHECHPKVALVHTGDPHYKGYDIVNADDSDNLGLNQVIAWLKQPNRWDLLHSTKPTS